MRKHAVPGDKVLAHGLVILHEDRDILVVDKPSGLHTIATDRGTERNAFWILMDYVRKGAVKSRNRVFIVHRLDRETSGVLIFARTEEAKIQLQSRWEETHKQYLTVVHGKMENETGTITNYLAENSAHIVHATGNAELGKLARTAYRVLKESKAYSLLQVDLLTGRKHQIRVHMAGIGHPVVGDKKYGGKQERQPRIALHARSITFNHPFSGKQMTVTAPTPPIFAALVGAFELQDSQT